MKYKVIDIINGQTIIDTDSQVEIKSWFAQRCRLKELNVTGKDIKSLYTGWSFVKIFFYEKDSMQIRRYQVIDNQGRSVDPRLWEVESVDKPVCKQFDQMTPVTGYERHRARGKGRALVRQMKREAGAGLELDIRPIRSSTKVRTNKYDIPKLFRSEELQCWKNKKTSRQWARHEKGNSHPAKLADMFLPAEEEGIFYQGFLDDCFDDSPERTFV